MTATQQAYRQMLRVGFHTERVCGLHPEGGLVQHVRRRWREVGVANLANGWSLVEREPALQDQVAKCDAYCEAMLKANDVPAVRSMLAALATGVGSPAYVGRLEHGVMQYLTYDMERRAREDGDDTVGDMRQNRVLIQALLPIVNTLAVVHRHLDSHQDLLNHLSSGRTIDQSGGETDKLSHHVVAHGENETMMVEVDTALNKQTVYLTCDPYTEERDGDAEVEILEPQMMRGLICHAGWYRIAQRYVNSLLEETPLHKSRGTVVVGHGAAGAVAFGVAVLLQSKGFEITNTITFGSCKFATRVFKRYFENLNIIRVVMVQDSLPNIPTTSNDFQKFVHYGEEFALSTPKTPSASGLDVADDLDHRREANDGQIRETFSVEHYRQMMQADSLIVEYSTESEGEVEQRERFRQ